MLCVERRGGMVLCNQDNGGLELIGEKIRFMSAGAGYNSPNISQHYPTLQISKHLICTSVSSCILLGYYFPFMIEGPSEYLFYDMQILRPLHEY